MQPNAVLRYLAAPLRTAPLLFIVVFSVLFLIAFSAGLIGIWLGWVLLSGFLNYGFILMDSIANGEREPPVLSIEMMNPMNGGRWLMMLAIVAAGFFVSDAAVYWLGPVLGTAVGLIAVAILPAVITVQGATGSVVQSLNLLRCWRLILRLRGDYAFIVLWGALYWSVSYVLLRTSMGDALPLIVRIAWLLYGWLAMFTLIGGVLFERQDEIGLADANTPEHLDPEIDATALREKERDRHVDRIYAQWRGGAHVNAWQSIGEHLDRSTDPLVELRWLYERIARWPDPLLANRLAQSMLPRLLAARRYGEALQITRERIKAFPEFRPTTAAELVQLARLACDGGDRPTARTLLRNFQQFYADDALRPVAEELLQQIAR
jgi:hypothetical protein